MRHPQERNDLHAARREQRHRKRRYGMRTTGAGARLLAHLMGRPATARPAKKRRISGKKKSGKR